MMVRDGGTRGLPSDQRTGAAAAEGCLHVGTAELKDQPKRGSTNLKQVLGCETNEVFGKMKVLRLEARPRSAGQGAGDHGELEIAPTRRPRGLVIVTEGSAGEVRLHQRL